MLKIFYCKPYVTRRVPPKAVGIVYTLSLSHLIFEQLRARVTDVAIDPRNCAEKIFEHVSKNEFIEAKRKKSRLRGITFKVGTLFETKQCSKKRNNHKQPVNALQYFALVSPLSAANEPSSHLDSGNTDVFTAS